MLVILFISFHQIDKGITRDSKYRDYKFKNDFYMFSEFNKIQA